MQTIKQVPSHVRVDKPTSGQTHPHQKRHPDKCTHIGRDMTTSIKHTHMIMWCLCLYMEVWKIQPPTSKDAVERPFKPEFWVGILGEISRLRLQLTKQTWRQSKTASTVWEEVFACCMKLENTSNIHTKRAAVVVYVLTTLPNKHKPLVGVRVCPIRGYGTHSRQGWEIPTWKTSFRLTIGGTYAHISIDAPTPRGSTPFSLPPLNSLVYVCFTFKWNIGTFAQSSFPFLVAASGCVRIV